MEKKVTIPTPHITANKEDIAKIVIMPGDPLRAKYIAEKYLQNVKQVNAVRNMLMYTGQYQGSKITVASSGMGMPSMGIYSYELFNFYEVDCIIRVGSAGSYQKAIKVYDVINVKNCYTDSSYGRVAVHNFNGKFADLARQTIISSSKKIYEIINMAALEYDSQQPTKATQINLKTGMIHSTDVFYRWHENYFQFDEHLKNCLGVEMETFALFVNALLLNKNAACLLTVSDSFVDNTTLTAEERQTSFDKMAILSLQAASVYDEKWLKKK